MSYECQIKASERHYMSTTLRPGNGTKNIRFRCGNETTSMSEQLSEFDVISNSSGLEHGSVSVKFPDTLWVAVHYLHVGPITC